MSPSHGDRDDLDLVATQWQGTGLGSAGWHGGPDAAGLPPPPQVQRSRPQGAVRALRFAPLQPRASKVTGPCGRCCCRARPHFGGGGGGGGHRRTRERASRQNGRERIPARKGTDFLSYFETNAGGAQGAAERIRATEKRTEGPGRSGSFHPGGPNFVFTLLEAEIHSWSPN